MQAQITQQRKEIQSPVSQMERRLKDKFFSRIDSFAEAIRPAPAVTSIESGVNECMHGVDGASERFVLRVDGSLCFTKVSTAPLVAETPSGVDAAASELGYNVYSTQPPPCSGRGSWECERAAIV